MKRDFLFKLLFSCLLVIVFYIGAASCQSSSSTTITKPTVIRNSRDGASIEQPETKPDATRTIMNLL